MEPGGLKDWTVSGEENPIANTNGGMPSPSSHMREETEGRPKIGRGKGGVSVPKRIIGDVFV
jgi:hypothetical protein